MEQVVRAILEGEDGNNMQQLPNGNFQIKNGKTGEVKEVTAQDLPKYGLMAPLDQSITKSAAGSTPGSGAKINPAELIPSILGTAGAIGGGLLGTAVEPGGGTIAGGALGGGAGQAAGKFIEDLVEGKQSNVGDVAKEGVTGAIFGGLPGGAEGGLGTRILSRLLLGAGAGSLNETAKEVIGGENLDPGKIAKEGALTGGANTVLGGGMDTLHLLSKMFGKNLPEAINKAVAEDQTHIGGQLVGANNVATAKELGILPEKIDKVGIGELNTYKQNADQAGQKIETALQEKLSSGNTKTMTYNDLRDLTQQAFDRAPQYESAMLVKPQQLDDESMKMISAMLRSPNKQIRDQAIDMMSTSKEADTFLSKFVPKVDEQGKPISWLKEGNKTLTASQVNDIKRGIGKFFNKSNLAKDLYSTFKDKIEELSGSNAEVSSLNQKAHAIAKIGDMLDKHINREGPLPENMTEGSTARIQNNPNLTKAKSAVNAGAALGGYMTPAKFIGYIGARGASPVIDQAIFNEKTAKALSSTIGKFPGSQQEKVLNKIIQMLGLEGTVGASKKSQSQ